MAKTLEEIKHLHLEGDNRELLDYLIQRESAVDAALEVLNIRHGCPPTSDPNERWFVQAQQVDEKRTNYEAVCLALYERQVAALEQIAAKMPSRRDLAAMILAVARYEPTANRLSRATKDADALLAALDTPAEPQPRLPDPMGDLVLGDQIQAAITDRPICDARVAVLRVIRDWLEGQTEPPHPHEPSETAQ